MTPLRCANAPSMAGSFLRIASRSCSTSATAAAPQASATPLEFLVPRHALRTTNSSFAWRNNLCRPADMSRRSGVTIQRAPRRAFTASSSRRATVCVQHPVEDEDGNTMMMEITPRAAKRLADIMAKDKNPNLALRIQVESGGCHGFQYLMSLITIPDKDSAEFSKIIKEDDTIFQFAPDEADGQSPLLHSPKVVLDEPSLELLKGSKVDFTMELIGSQFKITDNPYASSSCGCGTSFDIKM